MSDKITLVPVDVYQDGDLTSIEFYDKDGKFIVQSVWDENDPQDSEHRAKFREWSYKFVSQLENDKYRVEK